MCWLFASCVPASLPIRVYGWSLRFHCGRKKLAHVTWGMIEPRAEALRKRKRLCTRKFLQIHCPQGLRYFRPSALPSLATGWPLLVVSTATLARGEKYDPPRQAAPPTTHPTRAGDGLKPARFSVSPSPRCGFCGRCFHVIGLCLRLQSFALHQTASQGAGRGFPP